MVMIKMRIGATQLSHMPMRALTSASFDISEYYIPRRKRRAKNAPNDVAAAWHIRMMPQMMMFAPRYFAT